MTLDLLSKGGLVDVAPVWGLLYTPLAPEHTEEGVQVCGRGAAAGKEGVDL